MATVGGRTRVRVGVRLKVVTLGFKPGARWGSVKVRVGLSGRLKSRRHGWSPLLRVTIRVAIRVTIRVSATVRANQCYRAS